LVYPKKGKGGIQLIYWTRDENKADPVDLVKNGEEATFDFFDGDPELQRGGLLAALKAFHKGDYRPQGYESNQFYGCSLNGNGKGPLVVRDWWETSLTNVLQNVIEWFNDLEIANCRAPKFGALLYALVREDLKKELSTHIPIQLMRSALHGLPLPRAVLGKALHRHNIDLMREGEVRIERVALIKAFLNRVRKESDPAMTTELSKNETDHAYRCGRLLAVFEKIQRASRPDLNAGLVQRYYGAASSTPALVMPRLFKLSKHHLATLAGGLAEYFQKQIEEITDIKKMGTTFKRTLTLEEQGRFALGYYHQRAQRKDNDTPDIQQNIQ
jgi:CRISPR-associated protein Csd1